MELPHHLRAGGAGDPALQRAAPGDGQHHRPLPDFFANKAGVLLEGGDALFVGNAAGYIRLNLAMPRSIIETGLARMAKAVREAQVE